MTGTITMPSSYTPSGNDDVATKSYVLANLGAGGGSWSTSGTNLYNSNAGNVRIGGGSTYPSLLSIGEAPSGYDSIGWTRLTNNPNIQMGFNYIGYASNAGSWIANATGADMILRTASSPIRTSVDEGRTTMMALLPLVSATAYNSLVASTNCSINGINSHSNRKS